MVDRAVPFQPPAHGGHNANSQGKLAKMHRAEWLATARGSKSIQPGRPHRHRHFNVALTMYINPIARTTDAQTVGLVLNGSNESYENLYSPEYTVP